MTSANHPADATSRLLAGISVVELGDGIAGSVAAAQLAALGATVEKVVDAPRVAVEYEPRVPSTGSFLTGVLDQRKKLHKRVDRDASDDIVARAAIVIDDCTDGLADVEGHLADVARRNGSVWVTISPFGLDGPRARDAGGELVALAAGGLLSTISAGDSDVPVSPPGMLAMRATGHVAALAAMHGLDRRRSTGAAVHVDVSAQEAVVMVGALPECAHVLFRCPGRAGSGRYVAPSGAFQCRDGFVRIAAIENHQWEGMVRVLGAPEWTRGLEDRPARAEHAAFITEKVAAWASGLDKDACADALQREGVPSTPLNGPDEILASKQFAHRSFIVDGDIDGIVTRVPGAPWVLELDESSESRPRAGLADLRVVEFTHVLAAPIAGALIGAMGADVVRLEEKERLDLYRRTGPFADGIAGLERGAYFAVANHSKRSVAAEAADAASAAARLVEHSDVVLENVGGRRLEKLGVTPDRARSGGRGSLVVSLSGFGNDGPLAGYRVYANNVQAYGGLAFLSRDADGELARVGTVLADVLSSVVTATAIAAWWLGPTRGDGVLDISMAEVVATTVGEFVAEASTSSSRTLPRGCDLAPFAPHGVYRTAEDRWLALSVQSDAEWTRVLKVFGRPGSLAHSEWVRADARYAARHEIDDALQQLIAMRPRDELVDTLAAVGARVAPVLNGAELVEDPHLDERGCFPRIEHPDPDLRDARIVGLGWRFVGDGPIPLRPPPALGSTALDDVTRCEGGEA